MTNAQDCVDLGVPCVDVCNALDRGLQGKQLEDLSKSVLRAMQLNDRLRELKPKNHCAHIQRSTN